MAQNATNTIWRVRLFDGPVLESVDGDAIRRFRSHKVGALLAYLALHLDDPCPRETLCSALWPDDDDTKVVSNRLRVTLASLRQQMEPAGVPFGAVLDVSDPSRVRLRAETTWCDLVAFEEAWKAGRIAEAARLLRGPFLPGYFEEWALVEQARFELLRDELVGEALPEGAPEAPDLASALGTPTQRLPLYLTRFFGREVEQQQLQEQLTANRLVSLTGPGGIGKTRLAVEAVHRMPFASVFVSLAELPDPERLADAMLQAFFIAAPTDADPIQHLVEVLQRRAPLLLILDNVEHLLEPVATLSLRLLEVVPDLRLLITSRQRLDVPGEVVFSLHPLEPPPYATTPERLMEFPAIGLFLDRARNARPDFALTSRHTEAVVEICRRLEGMPLALELAAARVTAQSPIQIAEALSTNMMDLKSRQRGLSERHRSLRAAIQGSFDLLSEDLRRFFARLSVFQGGWTAEAARSVADCAEAEAFLEELVLHSLVAVREEETTGALRYSFLETLRQFAAEQLSEYEREQCTRRHSDYYLSVAAGVREDDIRTVVPLDAEYENLLLALDRGNESREEVFWRGLIGALIHAFLRGHHRIAVRWIDATADVVPDLSDLALRTQWRYAAWLILPDIGRLEETARIAEEMRADSEAHNDPVGVALALCIQGYVEENRGSRETAVQLQREALRQARTLQDASLVQVCLSHTSGMLHGYGVVLGRETEAGRAALQEAEALAREFRNLVPPHSRRISLAPSLLAVALMFQNKKQEAYTYFKETQRACIALGTTSELMYSFIYESEFAIEQSFYKQAALLYGAFLALQERMGYSLARAQSFRPDWIQQLCSVLEKQLGSETFSLLVRLGRQIPPTKFASEQLPYEAIVIGD